MELRKFGNTELNVTPIVFGAWEIGGEPFFNNIPEEESIRVVKSSYDMGINFFDTAPVYGFGHAERTMGKAIKGFRDKIVISTKCGLRWRNEKIGSIYKDASKKSILEEIDFSLKRLDTDYIDLYLVHWPDTDIKAPISESVEALEKIKAQEKIKYYGLSNFSTVQLKEASKYGNISGLQSQYSMLCIDLERSELPYCKENNIGFQAYSPLHRGVLTDKTIDSLAKSKQSAINWLLNNMNEAQVEKVKKLKEIAKNCDVSFATFVMSWTISQPNITTAIVGTTNVNHIKESVKAAEIQISQEDNKTIRAILDE